MMPIFFIIALGWQFITVWGLGKNLNKALHLYGIQYQVNEILGLIYCVIWVCYFLFHALFVASMQEPTTTNIVNGCFILTNLFVLIFFLRSAKNGAITFLEEAGTSIELEVEHTWGNRKWLLAVLGGIVAVSIVSGIGWTIMFSSSDPSKFTATEQAEIDKLIEAGGGINAVANDGSTALHRAVFLGNIALVQHLVSSGADVNIKGVLDNTPLFVAVGKENLEVLQYLVSNGANHGITLCRYSEDNRRGTDNMRLNMPQNLEEPVT